MDSKSRRLVLYGVALFVLAGHFRFVVSQSLDGAAGIRSDVENENDAAKTFRKMVGGLRTVGQEAAIRLAAGVTQLRSQIQSRSVYDVVKNDTELGVNVLAGLIKVDRLREPGKPRSTSVRIFGIPVYNRGFRQDDVLPTDRRSGPKDDSDVAPGSRGGGGNGASNGGSGSSSGSGEEEELPLD